MCPYQAKKAITDSFDKFNDYNYKIALPAPTLYGQFDRLGDVDYIVSGLYGLGFDKVFEVARAAELISDLTRRYMKQPGLKKPIISSACPAIVRLISIRFPALLENVLPILPPVELAARMAKEEAKRKNPNLRDEDICAVFISPCPAKMSYSKNPLGIDKSAIDGVVSIRDIYFMLVSEMKKIDTPTRYSETGIIGISWAGSGGESSAILNDRYLAADGIENVIHVLDEIEKENITGLDFVELNACPGGCVGGTLNVENAYIAKTRLQILRRYLPVSLNTSHFSDDSSIPEDMRWNAEVCPLSVMSLDTNRAEAIKKMAQLQDIRKALCDLDCGSCGAPTCQALAEDIVNNEATIDDCIIILKKKLQKLMSEKESTER